MPTAGSNFSRYVIPDDLAPSGICCISVPVPNDRQWIAQFHGAIWRMSLQTHYERDSAHSGKIVAAKWREIWQEVTAMTCCPEGGVTQINTTIHNELAIQVYMIDLRAVYVAAALDVDVAWPGTPDKFDTDPADAGADISTRNRALCLVTESWVNRACMQGLGFLQDFGIEVAPLLGLATFSAIIPVQILIGGFVVGVFVLAEVAAQLIDSEYRSYLACAMYEALIGEDTNDFAAFAASMDNLPARPPPPQSLPENIARDAIETWLRSQLDNIENYLAFVTQLRTAMAIAGGYADTDCPCITIWSHEWLFGEGVQGDIVIDDMCGVMGTYNAGDDRYESVFVNVLPCLNSGAVSVRLDMPGGLQNITYATMTYDQHNEQVFTRFAMITSVENFQEPGFVEHVRAGSSGIETDAIIETVAEPGEVADLFFCVQNRQTSGTAGRSKIKRIIISGTGVDPFL